MHSFEVDHEELLYRGYLDSGTIKLLAGESFYAYVFFSDLCLNNKTRTRAVLRDEKRYAAIGGSQVGIFQLHFGIKTKRFRIKFQLE